VTPRDYNASRLARGVLTIEHVTELARHWQATHGLVPDGMAGPATVASIKAESTPVPPAELAVVDHWIVGPGATRIEAHTSWYGSRLVGGKPLGIVAHYTTTDPGTSLSMARHRATPRAPADRIASWHLTIDADGSIVGMVPLDHVAWHAGSPTAIPVPGLDAISGYPRAASRARPPNRWRRDGSLR
jgi:hypothetical protein